MAIGLFCRLAAFLGFPAFPPCRHRERSVAMKGSWAPLGDAIFMALDTIW